MKSRLLSTALAAAGVGLFAFSYDANAAPVITVQDSGIAPFTVFNVGTATNAQYLAGPSAGAPISTSTITSPGFDNISSIVFNGGSPLSGVYAGSTGSIADSPFTLGTFTGPQGSGSCVVTCAEYFAAQPGGSVTINFSSAQTTLDMLWGTVDVATGYNIVTGGGNTINGATINNLLGNPSSGTVNAAVEITGLNPFTSLTFSDTTGNSPAFEFDIGEAATPLPATLPLFAGGLSFVGYLTKRRKQNAKQALAAA